MFKLITVMVSILISVLATAPAYATGAVETAGFFATLAVWLEGFPAWLVAITTVVTACTAITTLTPTKSDDKIINMILSVLNLLAGNFGKNTNKDG